MKNIKTSIGQREIVELCPGVGGDFGALTRNTCPPKTSNVRRHVVPDETTLDIQQSCIRAGVRKIVDAVENLLDPKTRNDWSVNACIGIAGTDKKQTRREVNVEKIQRGR